MWIFDSYVNVYQRATRGYIMSSLHDGKSVSNIIKPYQTIRSISCKISRQRKQENGWCKHDPTPSAKNRRHRNFYGDAKSPQKREAKRNPRCWVEHWKRRGFFHHQLVAGWWFQPLWKIWFRQLGWLETQYVWENKNGNQTTNQIGTHWNILIKKYIPLRP